jgi:glycosyltransferase involved in cell wall biosynthesis
MSSQKILADPAESKADIIPTSMVDVNLVTYNHERFVGLAIESVLAQETNFEYRLIIGDDCSTDNTQSIIKDYAEQYPKQIQLFLPPTHRGIEHKNRVGLEVLKLSTAKYVALLDGDDYWSDPHKLQMQVDFLESHPDYAICFHNARILRENGTPGCDTFSLPDQKETSTIEDLLRGNFMFTGSTMFRGGLFGDFPDWFYTSKMGDWPLHIMNAQYGKIGYLNVVMAVYRVHEASWWSLGTPAPQLTEAIAMLDNINAYLGFKYDREIKTTQYECYVELAEMAYQQGDLVTSRTFLEKSLKLGLSNYRLPTAQQLGRLFKLQNPTFSNLIRSLGNLVYSRRS